MTVFSELISEHANNRKSQGLLSSVLIVCHCGFLIGSRKKVQFGRNHFFPTCFAAHVRL